MDRFEQLRRDAYSRGRSDAARALEEYERLQRLGEAALGVKCDNPYEHNYATDESQYWREGFAAELFDHSADCPAVVGHQTL